MGALKGSVTVRRYVVRGEPPRDKARLVKGVRAHALLPIDPASDVERSHGWACMEDPEDTDLTSDKMFFGGTLALALRIDTLRPPAGVVKRLVAEKLRPLGRKPNKSEKQAATDEVKRVLRGRYLPVTKTVDIVWQLDEATVYVWSHAKGMNELALDLFGRSFGLELVPNGPALVAGRAVLPADIEPTPEMVFGFPGLPGRSAANEGDDDDEGGDAEEWIDA